MSRKASTKDVNSLYPWISFTPSGGANVAL